MDAATWWRILSLTLYLFGMLCLALLFYYYYGLCRLAEERFGKKTFAGLLVPALMLIAACGLGAAVMCPAPFGKPWFGVCSLASALLLASVSMRCFLVMMKR